MQQGNFKSVLLSCQVLDRWADLTL